MFDKDIRICIIGAGPAGLSAGMYLEQKGYTNYTILERDDHVGGKCHSPEYNGKHYEMGAIMGVPSYYAVHDVEEFCGFTHDGPALDAEYAYPDGTRYDPMDDHGNPEEAERILGIKNDFRKLCMLLLTKYEGYDVNGHRGVAEGRYEGFSATADRMPVSGENPNLKDLALPFDEFLRINDIWLIRELWIDAFTSFGYGFFDEIPAAYVLKYLDFETNSNFMRKDLWTWNDGTQSIWIRLNDKLRNPARLNCSITEVNRQVDKVVMTVNGEQEEYDKVIITAPLQFMPEYFDATEEEKALFSKIEYERYDILGYVTEPEDHPEKSVFIREHMESENYGRLMLFYRRWFEDKDQVLVTYSLRNHRNKPELSIEENRKNVLSDCATMGAPAKEVVNAKDWYYFPHIFTEDYADGWYDKVEAMQGQLNTYYAGEIMSFGDMDETAEYSRELVERFF